MTNVKNKLNELYNLKCVDDMTTKPPINSCDTAGKAVEFSVVRGFPAPRPSTTLCDNIRESLLNVDV